MCRAPVEELEAEAVAVMADESDAESVNSDLEAGEEDELVSIAPTSASRFGRQRLAHNYTSVQNKGTGRGF